MTIPSNVLQSMMALNAESITQYQDTLKLFKGLCGIDVSYISYLKKRAKILERNQKEMGKALREAYEEENFQRAVKLLTEDLEESLDIQFED